MVQLSFVFRVLATSVFATLALATPVELGEQSAAVTCGGIYYTDPQVLNAKSAGTARLKNGSTIGGYPHTFVNKEALRMSAACSSAGVRMYEWPLTKNGVYTGGDAGADRVVLTGNGNYCALVTHTGAAEPNGFVLCTGS